MNAIEKVRMIKDGKMSAVENVKGFLSAIDKDNKKGRKLNCVLVVNENALEEARQVDDKIKGGKGGRLAGLGIIVKSNICVKGLETNCASKVLEGWKATYDASVVKKIRDEDGIILGMANMDEFACGSSGETSAFGVCKNPVVPELIAGGSSSGSAASVAAGFCDAAIGSDTGGSIRNPASHCGVVGVKPTYGLVSRYGLIDLAMSLDQIGSLAKDVESCALILDVIKGKDGYDAISYDSDKLKISKIKNFTIGLLDNVAEPEIQKLVDEKVEEVKKKFGCKVKKINLKYLDLAIQTYYPLVYVEFFSGTRKFDGRRYGKFIDENVGEEVLRRILGGKEISRAEYEGQYYNKALQVKELIKKEVEKVFKGVDCIIVPSVPKLPHKIGSDISVKEMYGYDVLTTPANLSEICAISVPAGKVDGIPTGLQVMCKRFDESKMFSIAKCFERLS